MFGRSRRSENAMAARLRGDTDDLATLSRLDENILLEELRSRYSKDRIYVSSVRTPTPPPAQYVPSITVYTLSSDLFANIRRTWVTSSLL